VGLALALLAGVAFAQGGRWELRICTDPAGLPFSGQREPGFENRVAELELGKGPGTAFGPDHQLRQPLYAVAVDPEAPWGASAAAKAAIARVLAALPMPAMTQFSGEELRALVAYLESLE
jgi:cytochrome c1